MHGNFHHSLSESVNDGLWYGDSHFRVCGRNLSLLSGSTIFFSTLRDEISNFGVNLTLAASGSKRVYMLSNDRKRPVINEFQHTLPCLWYSVRGRLGMASKRAAS